MTHIPLDSYEAIERLTEAEAAVHRVSKALRDETSPARKAEMLWVLGYVKLRGMEDLRPAGGFGSDASAELSETEGCDTASVAILAFVAIVVLLALGMTCCAFKLLLTHLDSASVHFNF